MFAGLNSLCGAINFVLLIPTIVCAVVTMFAVYKVKQQVDHVQQQVNVPSLILPSFEELKAYAAGDQALMESRFSAWSKAYNRVYSSEQERRARFGNFIASANLVQAHNAKATGSMHTLGLNQFADWSDDEFMSYYNLNGGMKGGQECSATKNGGVVRNKRETVVPVDLPDSIDWREKGIVSPVKNQGHCGSCWTFSTTGALEAAYKQKTGRSVILSEQQLIDCAGNYDNHGCNGGLPSHAFQYIKEFGGLDTEKAYKYEAVDGKCRFRKWGVGVQVKDVFNITQFDETQLQVAVGTVRPVSIAFQVASDFRLYAGGVYSSSVCQNQPKDVNHAVLAVGYGTSDVDGRKYWIIKNSWGPAWGDKGYFLMERGKNMCGISDCASYPIL